jgi:hypothetical protein
MGGGQGHLACGDLMIEPILGEVRVAALLEAGYDETRHQPLRQVHWIEDDGLSSAARLYPTDAVVAVRQPALLDRALIRRGIDQAAYWERQIEPGVARLIAAHLHRGPGSAVYAFAVSGAITDRLYEELDEARGHPSQQVRRWVHALGRYCLGRADRGPIAGWAAENW